MRAISLVALGAVVATAIFGAFRFQPTGLAAELNKLDQETDGLAFFRKFCGACHCDKHKGNSKWNACSLESLTSEKPTADILGDYKNAKGYVVPGKPEESLVFLRVKDKSMPKGDGPKPSDDDKKKLEKWIVDLKVKPAKADAPSENQAAGAHSDKPAKSDENAPMSLPRLAFAAYSVFKDKCFGCHHAGREDGAPDFSNPVNIRTKRVGQYVLNGRMPLVGALSYQEKALLLEWIGRDAPGKNGPIKWGEPSPLLPPECRNTDFVELKDNLAAMQSWLFTLDKETQRYTRFLTLTNLHNDIENTSERELRLYRAAVSKVLNSLSTEKDICTPAIVDKGTQTVLAIDLRHYWKNEQGVIKWKRILNQYPYGVDYRQSSDKSIASLAKEVSRITGTDVPFIRADWFVAVATQPPLYHILVGTPATIAKLDDALLDKTLLGKAGVDFAAAFKNKLIIRAATDSGLTT